MEEIFEEYGWINEKYARVGAAPEEFQELDFRPARSSVVPATTYGQNAGQQADGFEPKISLDPPEPDPETWDVRMGIAPGGVIQRFRMLGIAFYFIILL